MAARSFGTIVLALAAVLMTADAANAFSYTFCQAKCRYDRQCSKKALEESKACDTKCVADCEKKAADEEKAQ